MIGATMTPAGTPALTNVASAPSRRAGVDALGSILRASPPSSVVTGGEPHVGVRRPCEAIAAAVFAAAIGIDRLLEGYIGRIVGGDDHLRRLDEHLRLERRQVLERIPSVIENGARMGLEAAAHVD